MFVVLAELGDNLIIRDDSDNAVDVVPKVSVKTLLNFGVSISGADLSGSDLVVKPTMQYFAESFMNNDSEVEAYEDEDDFYYGDYEDDSTDEEEYEDDSTDEEEYEDDTYEDFDESETTDFTTEEDAYCDNDEDIVYYDDIEDEGEDASSVARLYSYLSPEQVKIIKRYYLWFSQRIFTDAQKDPTLGIKSAALLAKKKADLAQLRNTGGLWYYAGFIDMGYKGAGYCTLGHPLRYLHLAWDVTESDIETAFFGDSYEDDFEDAINSNNCIVFGIKCISDFFEVNKDCTDALQKAQRDSLNDMNIMCSYYDNNQAEEINATFTTLDEILSKTKIKDTKGVLLDSNYKPLVPLSLQNFYFQFREAGIVPPKSMIQEIRDALIGWKTHKFKYERYHSEARILRMPSVDRLKLLLSVLLPKSRSESLVTALDSEYIWQQKWGTLEYYIYTFLSVYFMYKICGHYAYNGDTQTDEGGKNKLLLEVYHNVMNRTKKYSGVSFDLASLEKLNTFANGITLYKNIEGLFKVPSEKLNLETDLYEVDMDRCYFKSDIVASYSEKLLEATSFFIKLHSPRHNGVLSSDIDKNIAMILEYKTCIEDSLAGFKSYAVEAVKLKVDKLNEERKAKKEADLKAEEERKAKLDAISSNKDIIKYLKDCNLSSSVKSKHAFAIKLINQLYASGKEPTSNQMFYINKMYSDITGKTVNSTSSLSKVLLSDKPELEKALKYIVSNKIKCADDRTFDIICSIVKYGSISEKQMKYAESGLETYRALGKE